ncbi:hypothetical protein BC781_102742 [Sediminitomix flava]|uniref:Transmembrane protein n=2 Tax=Sediminitomix flava TaxID=379075 RepID=A0A315ZDJ5_SEDFL|nr:hypothetical protein BC781_102742 [Sediminitomix flava]
MQLQIIEKEVDLKFTALQVVCLISFLNCIFCAFMGHKIEIWFGESSHQFELITASIFLISVALIVINSYTLWFNTSKTIGQLELTHDCIYINGKQIFIDDINDITFDINYFRGEIEGRSSSDGTKNFITFVQNNQKIKVRILLENEYQIIELDEFIKMLYSIKFKVRVYRKMNRSYLLDENLSFDQIQDLKTKYQLKKLFH